MKNENYFILLLLICTFGVSHTCIASERLSNELKPLVASFFYCFDIEPGMKKPGIIYYRKLFNQYSSDLYNSEFYRNRAKDAALIKAIKQKAHDKSIRTIQEKQSLVREQIMRPHRSEGYWEELGAAKQYREKCYKEILHAANLTNLLYVMLNTLASAGFSQDNIYWELKEVIKNAIKIDNPEVSVPENNKIAKQIIDKLRVFEKKKTAAQVVFEEYGKKREKRIAEEKKTKIPKITASFFDRVKSWFKSWW